MKYGLVTLIFLIGHWGIQEFDIKRRDLLLHVYPEPAHAVPSNWIKSFFSLQIFLVAMAWQL